MAGKSSKQRSIGREILEFVADEAAEARLQRFLFRENRVQRLSHLLLGALVERHDNGVLGIKVVVGRAHGYSRSRGDLAHGGFVESALPEDGQRGFKDARSRGF